MKKTRITAITIITTRTSEMMSIRIYALQKDKHGYTKYLIASIKTIAQERHSGVSCCGRNPCYDVLEYGFPIRSGMKFAFFINPAIIDKMTKKLVSIIESLYRLIIYSS